MVSTIPLACFLSLIRPPGIQFEDARFQILPVNKAKCPFVRDHTDITFQLYTKHNPTVFQELILGDDHRLAASNFDFTDQTVIYFHAFLETPDDGSGVMVREAYVLRGDTNVIMVDAQNLEAGPWYFTAAENTWYIGHFAAKMIDYLVSRGLDLSRTHLVGHSLGGQSAGVAGSAIKSGRVSRITALDPALPLFSKLPIEQRLDPSDAEFVDVIHTDGDIFGFYKPIGHVDFYPNGGISPQPGCELKVVIPQQLISNTNETPSLNRFFIYYLTPNTTTQREETKKNHDKKHIDFSKVKKEAAAKATFRSQTEDKIIAKCKAIQNDIFKIQSHLNAQTRQTIKQSQHKKNLEELIKTEIDHDTKKSHVTKRQKRFIPFLKRNEQQENDNFLFKMLDFVIRNRKHVIPVFTVMREINTLVKSSNGELNHVTKERNNYIGAPPPTLMPVTYTLELGNDHGLKAFVKKLLGLGVQGDKLTINNNANSGLFGK